MNNVLYWLWLSLKFNGINAKTKALIDTFHSVESIYLSKTYNNIRGLGEKDKQKLLDKDLSAAKEILGRMSEIGGRIIVYDDENYPSLLKNIHNPPSVLYVKGKLPELEDVLTIGVVGTRKMSERGRIITQRLCFALTKSGVITISGMAAGIDAVAAWTTLNEGGITVGVAGTGIDVVYPNENAELFKAIAENGCILSEYPPGTPPARNNFPARNRIIAGLSRGVLVTEAPERSGALITARLALEEGRDVFAVARDITDIKYSGTNKLIQQGAKLVMTAEDIISEYPYAKKVSPKLMEKPEKALEIKTTIADAGASLKNLNEKEKAVAELLMKRDMQIDEISRELNIPVSEANTQLIMLEMKGVVIKLPASTYRLKL